MCDCDEDRLARLERCLRNLAPSHCIGELSDRFMFVPTERDAVLGEGAFGRVYRMTYKSFPRIHYAVKVLSKKKIASSMVGIRHLAVELTVGLQFHHPNVAALVEVLHSSDEVYLVFELVESPEQSVATRLWHDVAATDSSLLPRMPQLLEAFDSAAHRNASTRSDADEQYRRQLQRLNADHPSVGSSPPLLTGSLDNVVKMYRSLDWKLPTPKIAAIMRQLLIAIDALHKRGIVHRDVKEANIVVSEKRRATPLRHDDGSIHGVRLESTVVVKLIDFGVSKILRTLSTELHNNNDHTPVPNDFDLSSFTAQPSNGDTLVDVTPSATEDHAAPEFIRGCLEMAECADGRTSFPASRNDIHKIDIFAAGIVLYTLLHLEPPFIVEEDCAAKRRAEYLLEDMTLGPGISFLCPVDAVSLLRRMLATDQKKRPTAGEALLDPFFACCDATGTTVIDVVCGDHDPLYLRELAATSCDGVCPDEVGLDVVLCRVLQHADTADDAVMSEEASLGLD